MKTTVWLTAGVVVLCAVPARAEAPARPGDRAQQLVGTWSCVSLAGSQSTWTVTGNADGSLALKNVFQTRAGFRDEFDETYRFDPKAQRWVWNSRRPGNGGLVENGTAPPWTGDTWVFTGTMNERAERPVSSIYPQYRPTDALRMLYWNFDGTTFQREFDIMENGRWMVRSTSTCKRQS